MKRLLPPVLFAGILLLMTELSFRIYLYGPASIYPARMDSFTQIHDSGLVEAAEDPAIYYELKPNLDTWYKGARFKTNSAGLRGPEINKEKPAGVKRVAVLGASWSMGSGIEAEEIWHAQLAERLNADSEVEYEFINFAIDQYSVGEIVATLEKKVPAYNPDMVIIALTYYTPTVLWNDPPVPYAVQPQRHPFYDLHTLRVIDHRLGTGWFSDEHSRRMTVAGGDGEIATQLNKALGRLAAFADNTGTPVLVIKLAYQKGWGQNGDLIGTRIQPYAEQLIYFDLAEKVRAYGYEPSQLRISVWDSHPNSLGHSLIAESLQESLEAAQLIR